MKDNMIYQDIFKCSNCGYETDENYIGCSKCKEFGTIKFLKNIAVGPCHCADCVAKAQQKEKHFNHQFYIDARKIWATHQQEQIKKGAEKYPEPFTPSSWTNEQLVEHALQENVDQLHYIVGMKERMEEQEEEIKKLKEETKLIDSVADHNAMECERLRNEIEVLEKENKSQHEYIVSVRGNNARLESEVQTLRDENYKLNTLLRGLNQ